MEAAQRRQGEDFEQRLDRHGLITFLVRFVYVLAVLGIAYWWLARLRRRHTRLFPIGIAVAGAAAVQVVVMSFDYGTDYFDLLDLGPLVLSLVGIAMTTVAFVALQRYLARRVPARRVRKRECPFCGYPTGAGTRCEGCGREVVGDCGACGGQRRVGTTFCGVCGAA